MDIDLTTGLVWFIVFIFSTTFHEAAHAFISYKSGDNTAYLGGQVSLDPIPHIKREPFGMVIVPIISFVLGGWMIGWASTPYNYFWAIKYPKRSAMMSLAGPMANLSLALIALIIIKLGLSLNWFYPPSSLHFSQIVGSNPGIFETIGLFLSVTFMLNLLLMIFNLLPLPPLDGSGIITFFLSSEQTHRYYSFINQPAISIISIFVAWNIFPEIFKPIFNFVISYLLYPNINYV
jgi:Zn-dependent protease